MIDITFPVDATKYVRVFQVNQCKDYCRNFRNKSCQRFTPNFSPGFLSTCVPVFTSICLPGISYKTSFRDLSPTKILVKISARFMRCVFRQEIRQDSSQDQVHCHYILQERRVESGQQVATAMVDVVCSRSNITA